MKHLVGILALAAGLVFALDSRAQAQTMKQLEGRAVAAALAYLHALQRVQLICDADDQEQCVMHAGGATWEHPLVCSMLVSEDCAEVVRATELARLRWVVALAERDRAREKRARRATASL
jgi:hypothetical protein